ncbi:YciE/YciF ferroxidase family protein [Planosporangium mesophilum]|uniref:DUF892 family protein n=1 Tax=Planosporangium mesophilum TaxID=689768 RepID=A0A8J3TM78_9ACTN|nr:DUF892 family protein [Planosporangium mesophilum]NJC84586.1 DUF892 family protein [Planosporangium mesophilum]GII23895.1 hypothetical protein Pme01_34920 [Planosporangium mesophilum]
MAIASLDDLFVYELAGMRDEETGSALLLADMADQIRDVNLQQVLRVEHRECQRRIENLELCFHALGTRPRGGPSVVVDGLHADYQRFLSQDPSPVTVDMYTFGCALKLSHFGIGSYRALLDTSVLRGPAACTQALRTNLVMNAESAGRMERLSHGISRRIMATA